MLSPEPQSINGHNMLNKIRSLFAPSETKSNPAFFNSSFFINGGRYSVNAIQPQEMYAATAIGFLCVEKIVTEAEAVPVVVQNERGEVVENHPMYNLIFNRQFRSGGQAVFSSILRSLLIHGEAFILRNPYKSEGSAIDHLMALLPTRVNKITTNNDSIRSYSVSHLGMSLDFPVDSFTGFCADVIRISLYSTTSYIEGVSPMEAVGVEGSLIRKGLEWNTSILSNGAKLSGFVSGEAPQGLTEDQMIQIKEDLRQIYSGSNNAGRTAVLPGGYKWNPIQESGKDMDFQNALKAAMQNVAMAFKVPLPLIFEDASTLDNYKVAREEFVIQNVLPHMNNILGSLNLWFEQVFGDGHKFVIDKEKIEALEDKRTRMAQRMMEQVKAGIITPNEAREKLGYEPNQELMADSLFMPSNQAPLELLDGSDAPLQE